MYNFEVRAILSGRHEITVTKDAGTNRVSVKGIDPEGSYGQEDLADLTRVFAGTAVLAATAAEGAANLLE